MAGHRLSVWSFGLPWTTSAPEDIVLIRILVVGSQDTVRRTAQRSVVTLCGSSALTFALLKSFISSMAT